MTIAIHQNETAKETKVRQAFEAALEPGETLLEYSLGKLKSGIWLNTEYFIGLTNRRLIIRQPGKKGRVSAIDLAYIQSISYSSWTRGAKQALHITLRIPGKPDGCLITLRSHSFWETYSSRLAEQFSQLAGSNENSIMDVATQGMLRQVETLRDLYLSSEAEALLRGCMDTNPFLSQEPDVKEMMGKLDTGKLAMRVGAVMFGIEILFMIWLAIRGHARIGFGIVFAGLAVIDLLRGRSSARGTALGLALLTGAVNLIFSFGKSILDPILWVSFVAAMALVLVGNPSRKRVMLGGAVFAVGVVGVYLGFLLLINYLPDTLNALSPKPSEPYYEDFSVNQTWPVENSQNYVAGTKQGEYSIRLNQPALTYTVFPPLTYYPEQSTVDVRVARAGTGDTPGVYGLVCRFQEKPEKHYAVLFDPADSSYAVFRVNNEEVFTFTDPVWISTGAFRGSSSTNNVGMTCKDNTIAVTINGEKQAKFEDPGMAEFGNGKMGFTAFTWEDGEVPPEGFQVLIDNAKFWPPED